MAAETEIEGQKVVLALKNIASGQAVSDALIGCGFYIDDPDDMARVTSADLERGTFQLDPTARWRVLTIPLLSRGYVVEDREPSKLAPMIAGALPPHIKAAEEAHRRLAAMGMAHPLMSNDDAVRLIEALSEVDEEEVPCFDTRLFIAQIMRRWDLHRAYIKIAQPWFDRALAEGELLVDVLIQLTSAYRAVHDTTSAMRCTDFAAARGAAGVISPAQMSILFAQRAAIFLDRYDRERERSLLQQARACANRSYAISGSLSDQPSNEIRAVYNRLDRAESE